MYRLETSYLVLNHNEFLNHNGFFFFTYSIMQSLVLTVAIPCYAGLIAMYATLASRDVVS